jgi:hypothetical protein
MELIHNGRSEPIESARFATIGDVLAGCTEAADHVLVSLRLDGCEIGDGERAEVERISTASPGRLELESRPRRAVACDSLASAAEYAAKVSDAFRRMAGLLRDGEHERAHQLCRDCLDALGVLMAAVQSAGDALGDVAVPLRGFEPELERGLAGMEDRFAATDWIGLADCVEYEIAPAVARWPAALEAVRAAAEEKA